MDKCSNCGKGLLNGDGSSMAAFNFQVRSEDDTGKFSPSFIKYQVGDYKLDHDYSLCWECTLKGFGFKP